MQAVKNGLFCIKMMFRYAGWNTFLVIVGFVVPACFTGLQMIMLQEIVDSAAALIGGTGELKPLVAWGVAFMVMLALWVTLQRIAVYERAVIDVKIKKRMAPDIAAKLSELEFSAFEDQETQEVFQKMSHEPEVSVERCGYRIIQFIQALVSLVFTMAVYFVISPWVGVGVVIIGIPMAFMSLYSAGRMAVITEEAADAKRRRGDLLGLLTNKHAMYETKLFGAEELLTKKWDIYSDRLAELTLKESRKSMLADMGGTLLALVYLVFIICTTAVGFLSGSLTLGQFTAAVNAAGNIGGRVSNCVLYASQALQLSIEVKFYMQFMAMKPRSDRGDVDRLSHYDIAFENVSFTYPGTEREILKNVTFYIREGDRAAFVGENGAGKSTIIKLLCGLYEPSSGSVTVGGVPVRRLSEEFRTKVLSVVFQDFQSYELTLRENVAFGNLGALREDERLLSALKDADGLELVSGQEKGLDRNLGKLTEDGQDLSKGQWQRVAMARAFVSDAKYVILDEPTASLDPLAESHMYENFARVFRERGTIMISHRLASAKMADRIFVLDGGRIVQTGSHEELMSAQGLYATMFEAQSAFYQETQAAEMAAEN